MNWIKSERFHPVGYKLQIISLLLHNARQGLCIRVTRKFRDDHKIKGKKSALMRKLFSPPNNSELHKNVNLIVSTLLSCVQQGKSCTKFQLSKRGIFGELFVVYKISENSYCNTFDDVHGGAWSFLFSSRCSFILITENYCDLQALKVFFIKKHLFLWKTNKKTKRK